MNAFHHRRTFFVIALASVLAAAGWWAGSGRRWSLTKALPVNAPNVAPDHAALLSLPTTQAALPAISMIQSDPDRGISMHPSLSAAATIIGSAWEREDQPDCVAFRDWSKRFAQAPEADAGIIARGVMLAKARQEFMLAAIRTEPQRALAAAVPWALRIVLPTEVTALLEQRVDGAGELQALCAQPAPGNETKADDWTEALVNGRSYRVHPTGPQRSHTLGWAALHGVAIGRELAVSESQIRLVEPGEPISSLRPVEDLVPNLVTALPAFVDAGDHYLRAATVAPLSRVERSLANLERQRSPWLPTDRSTHNLADGDTPQSNGSFLIEQPPLAWTTGTKRLLIVRVDFADLAGVPADATRSGTPLSETAITSVINGSGGVSDFFSQASYGLAAISLRGVDANGDSPDITPVLRMPASADHYATVGADTELHADARAAATAAGFNIGAYDRIGVVFSNLASIPSSKITYGALGNVAGPFFWINGYASMKFFAHELGHTFGLPHAGREKDMPNNDPLSDGTFDEYGDTLDMMGYANDARGHFNPWAKNFLHWIDDSRVQTITASGTYSVGTFDKASGGSDPSRPLALRIIRSGGVEYWIGHRGLYTGNPFTTNGAYIVWAHGNGGHTRLIDCNGPTDSSAANAPLIVNQVLDDAQEHITITTKQHAVRSGDDWLDIKVTIESRLEAARPLPTADESLPNYNHLLLRTRSVATAIAGNWTTTPITAQAGINYTNSTGAFMWATGDALPLILQVPLRNAHAAGDGKTFSIDLTKVSGAALSPVASSQSITIRRPGNTDPGFRNGSSGDNVINDQVLAVAVDAVGRVIIGGWFDKFGLAQHDYLARLNPDGTEDSTFNATAFTHLDPVSDGAVRAIAVQSDGKILVGGGFVCPGGPHRLTRLNGDGSIDASFMIGSGPDGDVTALLVQPDGKILVGGLFSVIGSVSANCLTRLNADGTPDSSFTTPIIGGSFGPSVRCLALAPDGKIIVGGQFIGGIMRLGTDGSADTSFNPGIGVEIPDYSSAIGVNATCAMDDGSVVVGGSFTSFNGISRHNIAVLNADGSLSLAPPSGLDDSVRSLLPLPDGSIAVGGSFGTATTGATLPARCLAHLLANGTWDLSWNESADSFAPIYAMTLNPEDHRIVIGGANASIAVIGSSPLYRVLSGQVPPAPVLTSQPRDLLIDEGAPLNLNVRLDAPQSWCQWYHDGAPVAGATTLWYGRNSATPSDAGSWQAAVATPNGIVHSLVATVIVRSHPTISLTKTQTIVNIGESATLSVIATGGDLTYQWQKDEGDIALATLPTFTINSSSVSDAGRYRCIATNSKGSVTSAINTLIVVTPAVIHSNPEDVAIRAGQATALSVSASGLYLTYQWQKDGVNVRGATAPVFRLAKALPTSAGLYTCIITNSAGSVTSESGQLHIVGRPVITAQPVGQRVMVGTAADLSVTAAGEYLSYQWQRNGVALAGAYSATLAFHGVTSAQAGAYRCVVSNNVGGVVQSVASQSVTLTISTVAELSAAPEIDASEPPPSIVSGPFSWQLTATQYPVTFRAVGLPIGLHCDAQTGIISGVPDAPGTYNVAIIGRVGSVSTLPRHYQLIVRQLPVGVTGTFTALVLRDPLTNDNLGGRILLNVTARGYYSAKIWLGARTSNIAGRVVAQPSGAVHLNIAGGFGIGMRRTLSLDMDGTSESLSGDVDGTALVTGAKYVWSGARPADDYAGRYNCAQDLSVLQQGIATLPQGSGYTLLTVSRLGPVGLVGRLPDGTALSFSTILWPDGRTPIFMMLYSGRGSLTGVQQVSGGYVTGQLEWWKAGAASTHDHSYASGFSGVVKLDTDGAAWKRPSKGLPVLGLNTAKITFGEADLQSATQSDSLPQTFMITDSNLAKFDIVANSCDVRIQIDSTKGVFTGSFMLTDPNPAGGPSVIRPANLAGVLLSHRGEGRGFFTVPQLPGGAGAPILSGRTRITAP